jgi:phosphatidylserine/phosphatidylglycerophosphate/cardiolipin synthase-like enzyme
MGTELTHTSTGALRALRSKLAAGRLADPICAHDAGEVHPLVGMACAEAGRLLDAVLAERDAQPPAPELVWTGPVPVHSAQLDTAVTLRGLFERAKHRVIVAGYCFDHGKAIFAPLHHAMVARGVQVDLFMHVRIADVDRPKLATDEGRQAVVQKALKAFLTVNWPGAPFPRIHYDPRPITTSIYSSLHAKCVVVDEAEALVTSANFTDRGHDRNVEVGALIRDPRFAQSLATQWHTARTHGMFVTYTP